VLPVPVCLAISLLGLLFYLNLLFEARYCLLRFIPTPASLRMLWDLAGTGMTDAGRYVPPAQETPGLVLLAAGGIGITAAATDLIAVRLRSAALAGLPLLVLFTASVTMNAPSGAGTAVVFSLGTVGYLAMLSADGRERIRVWGRLVSLWRSGPVHDAPGPRGPEPKDPSGRIGAYASRGAGAGPDTRALAAAGRRVGLASVMLALCVPLIVPGLHPSRLFTTGPGIGGNGGGQATTAATLPDALAVTLAELREGHPTKVLAYTTSASPALEAQDAQYLQQYVLDDLSDSGWQVTNYYAGAGQATTVFPPPGLTVYSVTRPVTTTVTTVAQGALNSPGTPTFLPVPYPPTKVDISGVWLVGSELMVYSAANDAGVGSYRVTSLAVDPTAAQLNAAPPPPLAYLAADLQLPSSYRIPALEHIAESITAGAHTEFAKALALEEWLSGSAFTYDDAGENITSAQGLLTYLTKTRIGVCVQSAYAMTVLARLLSIPARMIRGYTTGTPVGKYSYVVTSGDSHVWPEIYFTGYGWMRFEPTPPGSQGNAHAPNYAAIPAGSGRLTTSPPPPTGPTTGPHPPKPSLNNRLRQNQGNGGVPNGRAGKSAGSGWAAIVLAVLAAIALACGVIAVAAPQTHRVLSAHPADAPRRRPVTLAAAALAAAAAAVVLLALYRVLSHAGLHLRADWATVGIAFGAACAVMLVAPATGRIVLRRWRWTLAGDDASRAHAAWREFRDDLADLGVSARPSDPPRTLADRVTAGLPQAAREAVRRLALAEERASYAAHPAESANLRRDGAAARRGIAATVGRGARWRARIFPPSVLTAAADAAAVIPDHVAALISRGLPERRQVS
jgi:transglutaminase-like putative cysteine protease